MSSEENVYWEHSLHDAYTECGCTLGAYCFIGAIGIILVLLMVLLESGNLDFTSFGTFAIIFIITNIIVGKMVGILAGRIRLTFLIKHLREKLNLNLQI